MPRPPATARESIISPRVLRHFHGRLASGICHARFAISIPSLSRRPAHRARRSSARRCSRERVEKLSDHLAFTALRRTSVVSRNRVVPQWETSLRPIYSSLIASCTDHPHGCCATPPPGLGSEACLIPLGSDGTSRCVQAPELLVPTESVVTRCEQSCAVEQTCVRLRRGEQFLRISVQSGDKGGQTRVVLWRGQREEVYQSGVTQPSCTAD